MTKVTIPIDLFDTDADIQQLAVGAVIKGAKPEHVNADVIYSITSAYLPVPYVKLLASKGVTIENHPLFIEIDSPDDIVPVGIVGSLDDEGASVSWNNWVLDNHAVHQVGARYFVGSDAHTGSPLMVSDLSPVFDYLLAPADVPVDDPEIE